MWYFTWMLGLGFACTFAILNALWLDHDLGAGRGLVPQRADPPRHGV